MNRMLLLLVCAAALVACKTTQPAPNILATPNVGEVKSGVTDAQASIRGAQVSSTEIAANTAAIRTAAARGEAKGVVVTEWLKKHKFQPQP